MLNSNLITIIVLVTAMMCGKAVALDPPDSQYFDSDGVRIHYVEQGSGEAIILLHGNTGSVKDWWRLGVFQKLAEDYRVIAFDARGHGKSDKPHDVSAYGIKMSQDIIRLLDHLAIEKAHIIASSMGVRIFGKLMPTHPERFLTAIFVGFAPIWNWSTDDQRAVEKRSENLLINPSQRLLDEGQDIQALATLVLGFSELVVTDQALRKVQIPTFAIIGSEDHNLHRVNDLKILMPEMEVLVIDGEKHGLGNISRHSEFLTSISSFIAEHGLEH